MNFTKTTEYSLRIMSYISFENNRLYTTNELFEKLQIPFRYLRKLMNLLTKQHLLESVQGKQGGYRIARALETITLMDIVEATEEPKSDNICFFGFQECPLSNRCAMHDKWGEVRDQTFELLRNTTLAELRTENKFANLSLKTINSYK